MTLRSVCTACTVYPTPPHPWAPQPPSNPAPPRRGRRSQVIRGRDVAPLLNGTFTKNCDQKDYCNHFRTEDTQSRKVHGTYLTPHNKSYRWNQNPGLATANPHFSHCLPRLVTYTPLPGHPGAGWTTLSRGGFVLTAP